MMPTSSFAHTPSTTPSTHSPNMQMNANRVTRKRNRVPVSCAPCRNRKLKCDRQHPCDNCKKRGPSGVDECTYVPQSAKKRGSIASTSAVDMTPDGMQTRIDRLENLVLSLVNDAGSTPSSASAATTAINQLYGHSSVHNESNMLTTSASLDPELHDPMHDADGDGDEEDDRVADVSQGIGLMKVQNNKTMFVSNTHWYAMILNDFKEMRSLLANQKAWQEHYRVVAASTRDHAPGADYFFRAHRLCSTAELLAELPNREFMDRLIMRYFDCYDPALHIVHGPTFQKNYEAHWQNPKDSSPMTLAFLFALMTIALQSYQRVPGEASEFSGSPIELADKYRRLTAQGLILADPRESHNGLLETLLLHFQAELARSRDTESGIHMLLALITRHAMKLGYHRDPSNYATVSVFDGEMRRRVWAAVRLIDYVYSFQCGLPAVIRTECADTQLPRNLHDDELHADMNALPPSQPKDEPTSMAYMLAKVDLGLLFGKIHDRVSTFGPPPPYDDVIELDNQLRAARARIPTYLQCKSLQESGDDMPTVIVQRIGLEMIYLKAQCILHRRFIMKHRNAPKYSQSRQTCLDAAFDTITHHMILHCEAQPGGRLHSVKWELLPVASNDITLAAMIICMDLHYSYEADKTKKKSPGSPNDGDAWAHDQRSKMIDALINATHVFEARVNSSMEAFKGYNIIKTMVQKLKHSQAEIDTQYGVKTPLNAVNNSQSGLGMSFPGTDANGNTADHVAPEHSAAMTLGLLSSGGVSPGNSALGVPGSITSSQNNQQQMTVDNRGYAMAALNDGNAGLMTGFAPPTASNTSIDFSTASLARMLESIGAEGMSTDMDWGAWDSYIHAPGNESLNLWPNVDVALGAIDPQIRAQPPASSQASQASLMGGGFPYGYGAQ